MKFYKKRKNAKKYILIVVLKANSLNVQKLIKALYLKDLSYVKIKKESMRIDTQLKNPMFLIIVLSLNCKKNLIKHRRNAVLENELFCHFIFSFLVTFINK